MIFDDERFSTVVLDSLTSNPCSPEEPDPTFLGILINAPRRVSFKKDPMPGFEKAFTVIPVCGYYILEMECQAKFPDVIKAMRLIAVSREKGEKYTGKAIKLLPASPDQKEPTLTPEQLKGKVTGGYFNSNLAERVPLPQTAGSYDIHVEIGERDSEEFLQSNIVTVEIVEGEE